MADSVNNQTTVPNQINVKLLDKIVTSASYEEDLALKVAFQLYTYADFEKIVNRVDFAIKCFERANDFVKAYNVFKHKNRQLELLKTKNKEILDEDKENSSTNEPDEPTIEPTNEPTNEPSNEPGIEPDEPTIDPSHEPGVEPDEPTNDPTDEPTNEPSDEPSNEPEVEPDEPTNEPDVEPDEPTNEPSDEPNVEPDEPTDEPTDEPVLPPFNPTNTRYRITVLDKNSEPVINAKVTMNYSDGGSNYPSETRDVNQYGNALFIIPYEEYYDLTFTIDAEGFYQEILLAQDGVVDYTIELRYTGMLDDDVIGDLDINTQK